MPGGARVPTRRPDGAQDISPFWPMPQGNGILAQPVSGPALARAWTVAAPGAAEITCLAPGGSPYGLIRKQG